ncbi:MAG: fatty acid CoA ligase family protein [Pirellulaceae bacterium]
MNVAQFLSEFAADQPDQLAIAAPKPAVAHDRGMALDQRYSMITFSELDDVSSRLAAGLKQMGVTPGMRLALMVPPSIDFITWVFALLKSGAVSILIDPGMGKDNLIDCLTKAEPTGFIGIPKVHAVRLLMKRRFNKAQYNVTVGRRWFWGGKTQKQLLSTSTQSFDVFAADESSPASIIFTTGSTGPPKGVQYRHGNFVSQITQLRDQYGISPKEIDLPAFPLFGLFNAAMGVTTVLPHMDFTQPASVDPEHITIPIQDWKITQSFGSPALWETVGKYLDETQCQLPSLKRVLSAGAPVPPRVLQRVTNAIAEDAEMYTPYGATEALPVASISGAEVLNETAAMSEAGHGTCVGSRFNGIQWKVIQIDDEAIQNIDDVIEVPSGEIGELIVSGPVVTSHYATDPHHTTMHKIHDEDGSIWHRMGDVGYLDQQQRFWFCGRKGHRVRLPDKTLFTIPCEAIVNQHPAVYRSALVSVHPAGIAEAAMVVQPWPNSAPQSAQEESRLRDELLAYATAHERTADVKHILVHSDLPVDIRHNSKIFREKLAPWAQSKLCDETEVQP